MQKIKLVNGVIEDLVVIEDIMQQLKKEKELKYIQYSVSDEVINAIKSKSDDSMLTYSEKKKLELRNVIDDAFNKALSVYESDYKELVVIPYDRSYNEEIETLMPNFKHIGDKVEQTFIPQLDRYKIKKLISDTQSILDDTDYIIIKSYEAKLSMSDAPYTQEYLDKIFIKRQEARDKINELKSLIK
jgi:hypothetical protein